MFSMADDLDAQKYGKSPEVHADGKITFRLFAPKANSVKLRSNVPEISGLLKKDDDGLWSITVGPLAPNTYPYRFDVDGAVVLDPVNRNTKAWLWMDNLVEVPSRPVDSKIQMHQVHDVPHGSVTMNWYRSPRLKQTRRVFVYTPPGYQDSDQKYPVLYLLHGFGDDESAWSRIGKAQHIADNMLDQERSVPAIMVMPFGHDVFPESPNFQKYEIMNNLAATEKELIEGVIPFIESNYRCKSSAADRAIAGLSMGGGQSLKFGISNLDKFRWIAGFSSSFEKQKVGEAASQNLDSLKTTKPWIWLGCGKDDFLYDDTVAMDKWLTENGVNHKTVITEGAHNWRCWRSYLEMILGEVFADQ
jgi:enterochelin esterase family protein